MWLGIVNRDESSPSNGQDAISSSSIVSTSTIVRPDVFVGGDPARPIRSPGVQLFLQEAPNSRFGRSFGFPQKQGQSVEQPLTRVAPGKRIADDSEAKRFQVQQIVAPRCAFGAFGRAIERIISRREKRLLQSDAFNPEPKVGSEAR